MEEKDLNNGIAETATETVETVQEAVAEPSLPVMTETAPIPVAPQPDPGPQPNLLVFGILALALGYAVGIPGIVLGIIGRMRGNSYIKAGGTLTGKDRAGYTMSLGGLILGIVNTVIVIAAVIFICVFYAVIIAILLTRYNITF